MTATRISQFELTTVIPHSRLVFVRFLEEFEDTQKKDISKLTDLY